MGMLYKFALCIFFFLLTIFFANAQQPALVIHRVYTNPSGNDSPFEFVELLAMRTIDFATEPYTIVAADGSSANTNGWATGGSGSYAFRISSGAVVRGDLIYVGGSGLNIDGTNCKILRQINTATTNGDGFGSPNASGVIGNGGAQADGVGVFNIPASGITSMTIPVDAVFFGSSTGSVVTKGFKVPASDLYQGGIFGSAGNSFIAPDPGSDDYIYVNNAIFYTDTYTWGTARSWNLNKIKPACTNPPNVLFRTQNNLSISFNDTLTGSFIHPPYISAVVNDPADPTAGKGITVNVTENNVSIPAADYTLSATSSNTAVFSNENITITKSDGNANIKLVPSGAGYSTVTITLLKGSLSTSVSINYAVSDPGTVTANTVWHSGVSDASAAIASDGDYMVVGDDENNRLYVYSRKQSGLPVTTFYYGDLLGLSDGSPGNYKETDVEAATRSIRFPGRQYWLGSMSNGSGGENKPNRNRLFAVTAAGSGPLTAFSVQGYSDNLRQQIISWGDANGYNLTASAATGKDAKTIDGFNAEGMAFGPDDSILYIAMRAPLVPVSNRTKALIVPLLDFETWFNNGSPAGNPSIGAPIELNLGGRGIRDIVRLSNGQYIILAGSYDDQPLGAVYKWSGNRNDQPLSVTEFNISTLNAEGVMELSNGTSISANQLQIISDNGSAVYYGDGIEAKDLSQNNFKKYRSDIIAAPGDVLPITFSYFNAEKRNTKIVLNWKMSQVKQAYVFEVQQSPDGRNFKTLGKIRSVDGQLEYSFTDTGFAAVSYYRIKANELTGNAVVSIIRSVHFSAAANAVKLYPNPVTGGVISVVAGNAANRQLLIYNGKGQLCKIIPFISNSIDIPTSGWQKGLYMFVVMDDKEAVATNWIMIN